MQGNAEEERPTLSFRVRLPLSGPLRKGQRRPGGPSCNSHDRKVVDREQDLSPRPEGPTHWLVPQVSFVIFNFVLIKKLEKLLLETSLPVMMLLISNILNQISFR